MERAFVGGTLLDSMIPAYAAYLRKSVQAYQAQGTPVGMDEIAQIFRNNSSTCVSWMTMTNHKLRFCQGGFHVICPNRDPNTRWT